MKLRQLLVVVIKKSNTTILAGGHVEVDLDKLLILGYSYNRRRLSDSDTSARS